MSTPISGSNPSKASGAHPASRITEAAAASATPRLEAETQSTAPARSKAASGKLGAALTRRDSMTAASATPMIRSRQYLTKQDEAKLRADMAKGKTPELTAELSPELKALAQRFGLSSSTEISAAGEAQLSRPQQLKAAFQQQVQELALTDPQAFSEVLEQAYGVPPDSAEGKTLLAKAQAGTLPVPQHVEFVDRSVLQGAHAAYSPEGGGTVFLSSNLLGDEKKLLQAFTEECGHHLDPKRAQGKDSAGDEGEIFMKGLARGGKLGLAELAEARKDRDQGEIVVDGTRHRVEFQSRATPLETEAHALGEAAELDRPGAAEALFERYRTAAPGERGELRGAMVSAFRRKASDPRSTLPQAVLDFASTSGDPELQRQLVNVNVNLVAKNPEVRSALAELAAQSPHPDVKEAMLRQLPPSPITGGLEELGKLYSRKVAEAIRDAPEGSKLHQLGLCLAAAELARTRQDVDAGEVARQIDRLSRDPEVTAALEGVRQQAVGQVFPGGVAQAARSHAEYLQSDTFEARLSLMPPEQVQKTVSEELQKLAALDPKLATETGQVLFGREALERSVADLAALPPEQRQAAVSKALQAMGHVDHLGKLARAISNQLGSLQRPSNWQLEARGFGAKILKSFMKSDSKLGSLVQGLDRLRQSGGLGGIVATAALMSAGANVGANGVPDNWSQWRSLASDGLLAASQARNVARLFGFSDEALKGSRLLSQTTMKALGPIASGVGAAFDAYGAWRDFQQGDTVGAWAKGIGAAAGGVTAAAGLLALSPAAGPGAPIVAGVAFAVGLGAMAVDYFYGESDADSMLRNLGVLKSQTEERARVAEAERRKLAAGFDGRPEEVAPLLQHMGQVLERSRQGAIPSNHPAVQSMRQQAQRLGKAYESGAIGKEFLEGQLSLVRPAADGRTPEGLSQFAELVAASGSRKLANDFYAAMQELQRRGVVTDRALEAF